MKPVAPAVHALAQTGAFDKIDALCASFTQDWSPQARPAFEQYLDVLEAHNADAVAVFAADHIYRMDVRQMAAFHRERGADVTGEHHFGDFVVQIEIAG